MAAFTIRPLLFRCVRATAVPGGRGETVANAFASPTIADDDDGFRRAILYKGAKRPVVETDGAEVMCESYSPEHAHTLRSLSRIHGMSSQKATTRLIAISL